MCYTIEKNLTREELEKRFKAQFKPDRPYSPGKRVSAFSFPEVPLVLASDRETIDCLTWGLIPFWTNDLQSAHAIRKNTLNAKAETIFEKPSFRHTVEKQRCLVLTNGFYEWQHQGKIKIPYFITLKDDLAMPMAGLYDLWTDKETGEVFRTFTIVTTGANPMMEKIHNTKKRMPLILKGKQEEIWLDLTITKNQIINLLKPFPEEEMQAVILDDTKPGKNLPFQQSLF